MSVAMRDRLRLLDGRSQTQNGRRRWFSDLLARFSIPELEIICTQNSIELRGTTTNGRPFSGVDFIQPTGCTTALMDFRPNDPSNSVNPSSDSLVGVYIFSTQKGQGEPGNIDATSIVIDSIRFGLVRISRTPGDGPRASLTLTETVIKICLFDSASPNSGSTVAMPKSIWVAEVRMEGRAEQKTG